MYWSRLGYRETGQRAFLGLGMDSWYLVEPIRFVGGILLIWNSSVIDYHPLGEGAQGVHDIIQVHNLQSSFIFQLFT